MIASIILMQLAMAPPIPRPEADRLDAAMVLWSKHPPSKLAKDVGIEDAVSEATTAALFRVGIQASPRIELTKRFIAKYDQLHPLIAAHIPTDRESVDRLAAECAVDGIARSLTESEIADVDRFTSTPAGMKFWNATRLSIEPLQRCYKQVLHLQASATDYEAIGLTPPKEPAALRQDRSCSEKCLADCCKFADVFVDHKLAVLGISRFSRVGCHSATKTRRSCRSGRKS